ASLRRMTLHPPHSRARAATVDRQPGHGATGADALEQLRELAGVDGERLRLTTVAIDNRGNLPALPELARDTGSPIAARLGVEICCCHCELPKFETQLVRSDWLMSGCYSRKAASFLPYRAAHEQRGDHRPDKLIKQTTHRLLTVRESNRLGDQLADGQDVQRRKAALGRDRDRVSHGDLLDRRLTQPLWCRSGEQSMRRAAIDVVGGERPERVRRLGRRCP